MSYKSQKKNIRKLNIISIIAILLLLIVFAIVYVVSQNQNQIRQEELMDLSQQISSESDFISPGEEELSSIS